MASFYIAAYNAKKAGINAYIGQLMLNTPRLINAKMDLAKMLAKLEIISELEDDSFVCMRQVRAGLSHFSVDVDVAKGQLAASTLLSLSLKPHIIHVVSFTEADHAAGPSEVIESCKIVRGVLRNGLYDFPDMTADPVVLVRKKQLIEEANELLTFVKNRFGDSSIDPLSDPICLYQMIKEGYLDAPHLRNNPVALGQSQTMPINGGYDSIDKEGKFLSERERLNNILTEPRVIGLTKLK